MEIIVRVDGGSDIGFGHIVRTTAIAQSAIQRGAEVTYATTTPDSVGSVAPNDATIRTLPSRDNPEPFLQQLEEIRPDVVLADAYPIDTAYQWAIRDNVPLAVLSDDTRHTICADLLINGNLYAEELNYEFEREEPQLLLGPKYVPLRKQIRELAQQTPPWREEPERALITMGGSDMAGLTPIVLQAFDGFDLTVDVVIGPGVRDPLEQKIHHTAESVPVKTEVVRNPGDFPERMFRADFAVSTASSTTYELLALGTPIISLPVAENQEPIASALRERNLATVLDQGAEEHQLEHAIEKYISEPELRQQRYQLGRNLIDGQGTERICSELLSLANGT